jgi:hypothetical protein
MEDNDNPIIISPHVVLTDGRQQRQPNVVVFRLLTQYLVVLWLGCRCLPSGNTICGRVMIGLSLLSSVSKHNMWHVVLTDGRQQRQPNHNTTTYCVYWRRQQRQPNHNTTTYCVYWRKTTTTTYVVVLWLGFCCCRPSVNTICSRIMIELSLSYVSKHNMWSYYDWVVVVFRQ